MIDRLLHPTPRFAAILALSWLVLCGAFFLLPSVDIVVASRFFSASACAAGRLPPCGTFPAASVQVLVLTREFFQLLPAVAVAVVALALVMQARAGRRMADARQRLRLAIVSTFALAPGLLVNLILKDHWGRPRPRDSAIFGGNLPFVPAGEISSFCQHNCSFVSGEAAGIFMLPLLALLAPEHLRRPLFALLTSFAAMAALLRVAFGAHWLSDAVLGSLATWVSFAVILAWMERLADRGTAK